MEFENIILKKEARIATLFINRPKVLNALNIDTLKEIQTAVQNVKGDNGVDVLLIGGAGEKSFVAGADISQMKDFDSVAALNFANLGQEIFTQIETMPKPVIAAVNGFALGGGCELAMACDIRIASEKAKFGQPEVGLGIVPGFGGTQRLPRLVGIGMAKLLLFTGKIISAQEALRIGLVDQVTEPERLMETVLEIANSIVANGQIAVSFCKKAVHEGMQSDIDRAMTIESNLFALGFSTADQKEGMNAFVEKRKANFIGK